MSDSGQSASASSTAASREEVDPDLYAALQARLLRSGEWVRLQTALRRKLDEAGFSDDLYDFTRETLRSDPALRFGNLMDAARAYGGGKVPDRVREEVRVLLMDFLERNLRC